MSIYSLCSNSTVKPKVNFVRCHVSYGFTSLFTNDMGYGTACGEPCGQVFSVVHTRVKQLMSSKAVARLVTESNGISSSEQNVTVQLVVNRSQLP